MTGDDARAIRALEDVVAVEEVARGLMKVVTWSDEYHVDARDGGCQCPDKEYHDTPICKHEYAALMADVDRLPSPWVDKTTSGTPTVMTDGGEVVEKPEGHDEFTVADMANENARFFDSKSAADEGLEKAKAVNGVDPKLFPPGESPEFLYHGEDADEDTEPDTEEDDEYTAPCANCGEPVDIMEAKSGPGRKPIHPDCREEFGEDVVEATPTPEPEPEDFKAASDLPERNVGDDPLTWMPGHFIDSIDGTPAINRKGFEVLAHHYDIDTHSELEVRPEENGHEYVRVKATAVTDDGRTCEAYGSAHVDRGDDPELLLEMADTRARKRALSIATGVGVVAVEELRNEVDR